MKAPDECSDIQEVREEIDIIDREVIEALSKRLQYVIAAAIALMLCYSSGASGLKKRD